MDDILLYRLTNELWKLVCTLETSGYSYCPFPVIVAKALLKREVYQCLLGHFSLIIGYSEKSRGAGSLGYKLGCQMEVIHVVSGQWFDHDTSGIGIDNLGYKLVWIISIFLYDCKVTAIDLFIDGDYHILWIIVFSTCIFSNFFNCCL